MSTESIQFTLRERFAAPLPEFYQRRIIFWQGEAREFESVLDGLGVPVGRVLAVSAAGDDQGIGIASPCVMSFLSLM